MLAHSSGDPILDRRFAYAEACAEAGDHAAAADLLGQILEVKPDWAAALVRLGEARLALGEHEAAADAFRRAAAADPADALGAHVALAAMGAPAGGEAMSPAFVAALFDQYAPRFDAHLTGALGYHGPEVLLGAIGRAAQRAALRWKSAGGTSASPINHPHGEVRARRASLEPRSARLQAGTGAVRGSRLASRAPRHEESRELPESLDPRSTLEGQADTSVWPQLRFATVFDLGCGTGLFGRAIRPFAGRLVGVDLSAEMVRRARAGGLYDALEVGAIDAFLARSPPGAADLIAACDAFPYLGNLAPVLRAAARALAPGGLIAFSVQAAEGESFAIGADHRFAHGRGHLSAALSAAGLHTLLFEEASTRLDRGAPLPGFAVVAGTSVLAGT